MRHSWLWKFLYGALFVMVVPASMFLWARGTNDAIHLPIPLDAHWGSLVAVLGGAITILGMGTLIVAGKGLPMNAFPPTRYVQTGIYRLIPHPIYVGFSLLSFGTAARFGSASGFWLVAPAVTLGSAALVLGYERQDLLRRFGRPSHPPLIALPANEDRPPLLSERLSVYALVLIPWVLLYEGVASLGVPADAVSGFLPFEKNLPVWEWTEIFYASTYVAAIAAPLVASSSHSLRQFAVSGLVATAVITLLFLAVPIIAPPRAFVPHGPLGDLLMWERAHDTAAAAFPSFHVVWAFLAVRVFASSMPRIRFVWWSYAVVVALSCLSTGMHSLLDVVAAFALLPAVMRPDAVWETLRSVSEHIANSWKEWRIGSVRIINHGFYGGLSTFAGIGIVALFLGPGSIRDVLIVGFSGLITAGLWAQFIEGSPMLLRPYGFYGGIVGIFIGCFIVLALGGEIWPLLGAFAVVAPIIQGTGRLRCLVQGCCHGGPAPDRIGIRYRHPRSRVCRLANLTDVPIHPTPLYSILWNAGTAVILARLWSVQAALPLIAGIYLILNGLGRFVEEAYRGEPQTPIVGGLRLYQWTAIASIVVGACLTTMRTASTVPPAQWSWEAVATALGFAFITTIAVGVDFPESNKRFSRLA